MSEPWPEVVWSTPLLRGLDARGKAFATGYYSADLHRGAQALPPFVAAALAG